MTWKLSFKQALAVRWEEEHLGLIETPATLPKRSDSRFVHPTLVIRGFCVGETPTQSDSTRPMTRMGWPESLTG
jgi:hypothetical protein